jgi:hypothetical protein
MKIKDGSLFFLSLVFCFSAACSENPEEKQEKTSKPNSFSLNAPVAISALRSGHRFQNIHLLSGNILKKAGRGTG